MKRKKVFYCVAVVYVYMYFTVNSAQENRKPLNILIVDTHFSDPYYFDTLISLIKPLDFDVHLKSWYQVQESDLQFVDFLYIEPSLDQIAAMLNSQQKNPALTLISSKLKVMLTYMQKHKKHIVLGVQQSHNTSLAETLYKELLKNLGISTSTQEEQLLQHLLRASAYKSSLYDTALLIKRNTAKAKQFTENNLLPIYKNTLDSALHPLYPFGGILSQDPLIILISADYLHAFDMQEDFMLNPMDEDVRQNLLQHLSYTWQEIKQLIKKAPAQQNKLPIKLRTSYSLEQHQKAIMDRSKVMHIQYQWIDNEKIACAWMNLNPFKTASPEERLKQAERIILSGINLLWLELMPEMYLGKRSLATQKTKDAWLESINQFTQVLIHASKKTGLPIPKILVGMELTWNFANKAPEDPARDAYGTVYPHIPSPLDIQQFWQAEVIDVFKQFYELWVTQIGNNIPLSGVFLDLEMYHAPKETGQFLNTMDFSDQAWHIATDNLKQDLSSHTQDPLIRITSLFENKLISHYFNALEQQAKYIGAYISKSIRSILPNAILGVYNITLPYNWFYKGFLTGLSSPRHPIILATFNLEAYRHYPWLLHHDIHIFHLPPLLLSKFRSVNDFTLIKKLSRYHDGVWFNRFSQLEEKVKDYQNVEVTKLPTDLFIKELNKQLPLKNSK